MRKRKYTVSTLGLKIIPSPVLMMSAERNRKGSFVIRLGGADSGQCRIRWMKSGPIPSINEAHLARDRPVFHSLPWVGHPSIQTICCNEMSAPNDPMMVTPASTKRGKRDIIKKVTCLTQLPQC